MTVLATPIAGCWELRPDRHVDARGVFVKPFARSAIPAGVFDGEVAEMFYSTSARGVVRGMHFQRPPHACAKLVSCVVGRIFDVVLDLRRGSPTFGQTHAVELSAATGNSLVVPVGAAHGFQSCSDDALVTYLQNTPFDSASDAGVHYASIGVSWPEPVTQVSARDLAHPALADFASPFA